MVTPMPSTAVIFLLPSPLDFPVLKQGNIKLFSLSARG